MVFYKGHYLIYVAGVIDLFFEVCKGKLSAYCLADLFSQPRQAAGNDPVNKYFASNPTTHPAKNSGN